MQEEMVSIARAAKILDVSQNTLFDWVHTGKLPASDGQRRGSYLVKIADLEQVARERYSLVHVLLRLEETNQQLAELAARVASLERRLAAIDALPSGTSQPSVTITHTSQPSSAGRQSTTGTETPQATPPDTRRPHVVPSTLPAGMVAMQSYIDEHWTLPPGRMEAPYATIARNISVVKGSWVHNGHPVRRALDHEGRVQFHQWASERSEFHPSTTCAICQGREAG